MPRSHYVYILTNEPDDSRYVSYLGGFTVKRELKSALNQLVTRKDNPFDPDELVVYRCKDSQVGSATCLGTAIDILDPTGESSGV